VSSPPPRAAVRVGTRGSALARIQTEQVVSLLRVAWPGLECELRPIVTSGDRTQASGEPLPEIGGKGLFTAELEQALRAEEIDLAVHSLKDLPTEDPPGIALGAVCEREDVRDCLVARDGLTLAALPEGAIVGTSSLRRAAQLRALRPGLEVRSIRGNVDTRIRKVREGEVDAVVLAAAGIRRLGLEDAVTEYLDEMLPAPGQGALAAQCRAGDEAAHELLAPIDHATTRAATTAERAFLRALGAGCTAPVAAFGELSQGGGVRLVGLVASVDGAHVVRVTGDGRPEEIGERLAREALAAGADEILDAIRRDAAPPLAGLRVVVTRPLEHAGPLVESLERLGAEASVVPLIAIEPTEDVAAFRRLVESGNHDWIVFTSANAVRVVGALLPQAGARFAAVGPATAASLRELGLEPAFVPERFAAEEIAGGLGPLERARVLLPQSEIAEPWLADELRARGAAVDVVDAYGTVALEPTDEELAQLRLADAILLASGSAARSLASALVPHERTLVVCIGPSTAEAARAAGLRVDLVAEESTGKGMIQALAEHVRERA
jgi:hydroxymethylbilane synthase